MVKDLTIFSFKFIIFILASLQKSWQSICNCICLALAIINLKIVLGEFLGLVDLSGAKTFCIHKMTKIVVIREDKHLIIITF